MPLIMTKILYKLNRLYLGQLQFFVYIGKVEVKLSMDSDTNQSVALGYPVNVTGIGKLLETQ